jgi:ppGpp synthetase/RelA/SpoT-type nucleotidyltranferase
VQRKWTSAQIERLAKRLWDVLGLGSVFNVLVFHIALERIRAILPGFNIKILSDEELPSLQAQADSTTNTIYIRRSVFAACMAGDANARMTVAHEIGHLFLHPGLHSRPNMEFRSAGRIEREAARFAAAFLAPAHLIVGCKSPREIQETFLISSEAAQIRWQERQELLRKNYGHVRALPPSISEFLKGQKSKGFKVTSLDEIEKFSAKQRHAKVWLQETIPLHEELTKRIELVVRDALQAAQIRYATLRFRTKTLQSATKKIKQKGYTDPKTQMTDLSGVQIVVRKPKHVIAAAALMEQLFQIDRPNSINKSERLKNNEVGYRSVHLVCSLRKHQIEPAKYEDLHNLKFEIQIRTVLDDLGAGLSHSSYKAGKMSTRKLNLLLALFELSDDVIDDLDDDE